MTAENDVVTVQHSIDATNEIRRASSRPASTR